MLITMTRKGDYLIQTYWLLGFLPILRKEHYIG